jgi:hypothetical protein
VGVKSNDRAPRAGIPRRRSRRNAARPTFPTLEPFGRRLESLRLKCGLTQRAVAARAHISTNHYQDIAHANANPTLVVLVELANALTVPLVYLFEPPMLPDDRRLVLWRTSGARRPVRRPQRCCGQARHGRHDPRGDASTGSNLKPQRSVNWSSSLHVRRVSSHETRFSSTPPSCLAQFHHVTERPYSPWVTSRQDQREVDVTRICGSPGCHSRGVHGRARLTVLVGS